MNNGRRKIGLLIHFLWMVFGGFVSLFLLISVLLALFIHLYGQQDRLQNAEVIVILAGPDYRAEHAASLWRQGIAPHTVCNGGHVNDTWLAQECRQNLLDLDIPDDVIILEETSLSTEEHAIYLKPIMEEHSWTSAVIVSSDYHMLRSAIIFDQYDIPAYLSPAPNPEADLASYLGSLIREILAIEWHIFKTLLGLDYTRVDGF